MKQSSEQHSLPVALTSFLVAEEGQTSLLTWQTASEINADYFEVQHSANGKSWVELITMKAQGNSSGLNSYHYAHTDPFSGDNYYRLKMVDMDGTFTYSKTGRVLFDSRIDMIVYPNPTAETIHLQAADWSKITGVQIMDGQGKVLYKSAGKPVQDISVKGFKAGLYFVKLSLADGAETVRKVAIGQ